MNLSDVEIDKNCVIKSVDLLDEQIKFRIMELGIISNTKILVKHKSIFKKTFVIIFNNSCFTISKNIANRIEVEYE